MDAEVSKNLSKLQSYGREKIVQLHAGASNHMFSFFAHFWPIRLIFHNDSMVKRKLPRKLKANRILSRVDGV